ncbi:hypothetical protein BKA65DRAFT_77944 [Rhexocercosporidium sp. MPI-PUGE-AT-0058]|nr:hypothetical protein BKA65DRAFT_77944 [Rhexocercosporidium sp. MPI-PUGE-AT-0058]
MSELTINNIALRPVSCLSFEQRNMSTGSSKMITHKVEEISPLEGSCFLDLPRELRDAIYSVIFVVDGPLYPNRERARMADYIALLRTNRQIYAEAVEILYGRNTFQIRGTPAWTAPEFLNLLGSQRRDGFLRPSQWAIDMSKFCLARHYLKRLYIPSHNINLDRLKHLDISWMLWEQRYRNWSSVSQEEKMLPHMWRSHDGVLRQAAVVPAPQMIPE